MQFLRLETILGDTENKFLCHITFFGLAGRSAFAFSNRAITASLDDFYQSIKDQYNITYNLLTPFQLYAASITGDIMCYLVSTSC